MARNAIGRKRVSAGSGVWVDKVGMEEAKKKKNCSPSASCKKVGTWRSQRTEQKKGANTIILVPLSPALSCFCCLKKTRHSPWVCSLRWLLAGWVSSWQQARWVSRHSATQKEFPSFSVLLLLFVFNVQPKRGRCYCWPFCCPLLTMSEERAKRVSVEWANGCVCVCVLNELFPGSMNAPCCV